MYNYNYYPDYLMHYGVKGMKWGHRKRQAFSFKAAGHRALAKNYEINENFYKKNNRNKVLASANAQAKNQQLKKAEAAQAEANKRRDAVTPEQRAARRKKAIIAGTAVAGTALAAYGAYKLNKYVKTKNCEIAAKRGEDYARSLFNKQMRDMSMTPNLVKGSVRVNPNAYAREAANLASKDNFRTAARNVANYRRSGQDMRDLKELWQYGNNYNLEAVFGKK